MAKGSDAWKVTLTHEPVVQLADNLRWVRGDLQGMSLKRTMTVVRRADGGLVIHNAIAMQESDMQALEAWGTPTFMIVPNGWHRMDAPMFKRRYPALRVVAPQGSRERIEQVVAVDDTYESFPNDASVRLAPLPGVAAEGVMVVTSSDGVSIVLNDAVFNMDKKRDMLGYLFTTVMGSAPGPRISRLAKLTLVKDKGALRAHLEQLAQTPNLVRLIVAHEKVASGPDAAAALLSAAQYL